MAHHLQIYKHSEHEHLGYQLYDNKINVVCPQGDPSTIHFPRPRSATVLIYSLIGRFKELKMVIIEIIVALRSMGYL